MAIDVVPLSIKAAKEVVAKWHRHHKPPQGALFAVGISVDGEVVGAAIIGRPVARMLDDGETAEVTRCVVKEGVKNGCSRLYGAACRAAFALGYRRVITYTLASESGVSLKASGWRLLGTAGGGSWSRPDRVRDDKHPTEPKFKWEKSA